MPVRQFYFYEKDLGFADKYPHGFTLAQDGYPSQRVFTFGIIMCLVYLLFLDVEQIDKLKSRIGFKSR